MRRTIQKKVTETHVKGFVRGEDGKAQSITITIPGRCKNIEIAQKIARKQNNSFMAVEFSVDAALYTATLEKFMEIAERTPITEED